ncbi:MAG: hypothetical protein ACKVVT_07460 [Dehalococcoidia bacterium]
MAKAAWSAVEALVGPLFEGGQRPERSDLVELAYREGADDDVVDALDSLGPRPVESLAQLKTLLEGNGVLA